MLIKQLRQANGLTQKDVAKLLGVGQNTYSKYEKEQLEISWKDLVILADYYGVSLDVLVERKWRQPT